MTESDPKTTTTGTAKTTVFKDASGQERSHPIQDLRPTRTKHMSKGIFGILKRLIQSLSYLENPPRRPSPSTPSRKKTKHARLITIKISHYCEKGRWALDIAEADPEKSLWYTEDAHPPVLSAYATTVASNDTASVTPMIIFKDDKQEEIVTGSDRILQRLCPQLYPDEIKDDITRMEQDLHDRLGTTIRVYMYHHFLQRRYSSALIERSNPPGNSKIEAFLFRSFLPRMAPSIRRAMKINPDSAAFSERQILEIVDDLSRRLEDGREYLMDIPGKGQHGFTAVDLTVSALLFHIMRPPEMKDFIVQDDDGASPEALKLMNQLRCTPLGRHVLKCYRKHRLITPEERRKGIVELKTMNRDRFPWLELSTIVLASAIVVGSMNRWLFLHG